MDTLAPLASNQRTDRGRPVRTSLALAGASVGLTLLGLIAFAVMVIGVFLVVRAASEISGL